MAWLVIVGIIIIIFGFVVFFGAPYVPSQRKYVKRAFENLYPLSNKDVLVDVGSGDGMVLRIAASYGARAIGFELNPVLVLVSRILSAGNQLVQTRLANFWTVNIPDDATIVYAFAVARDGKKLQAMMRREADRLNRPIRLMCLGSPLKGVSPDATFDAYALYTFDTHSKELKV